MRRFILSSFFGVPLLLLSNCGLQSRDEDHGAETAPEGLTSLSSAALAPDGGPVSFQPTVKSILENKCVACHSGETAAGGFRLDSKEKAFARGPGGPRIVPGKPRASTLLAFASTHKNMAVMPVVGNRLTATESRLLWRWIAEGAPWPETDAGRLRPSTASLVPEKSLLRKK